MDSLPVSIFDILVISFLFISAILSTLRGFFKEVLSVIAWVGAIFIMLYAAPFLETYLAPYISYPLLLTAVSYGGVFIFALIFLSLLSYKLGQLTEGSSLTIIDRLLGFAFGIVRGAVIIALFYLALIWIWSEDKYPEWLKNSSSLPYIMQTADLIKILLPNSNKENLDSFPLKEEGYDAKDRIKLKKLLETIE